MILTVMKFNANFTRGLMKNMVLEQTMTFSGETEAYDWAVRVNENERAGHCDYWVSDLEKIGVKELEVSV
jgi:hypothetical protein